MRGDLMAANRGAILRTVALSALTPLLAFAPLQRLYGLSAAATVLTLAALSATGTGVTLRLLAQRGALGTPSGRLLVGVSVLDDLPAIALLTRATRRGGHASSGGGLAWLG
ncbi:MAG: cation:proton antiporter, partial [bacterium]